MAASEAITSQQPHSQNMLTKSMDQIPIYKMVSRVWKTLPSSGSCVYIRDPKIKEGYLGDLSKKSVIELEEVLMRQDRILSNNMVLSKLKDRGQNLRRWRQEVAEALEVAREREISEIAEIPANISGIEWTGTVVNSKENTDKNDHLDSDDEDEEMLDPLELMAYHSSSVKKHLCKDHRSEEDPAEAIMQELRKLDIKDSLEQKNKSTHDFVIKREYVLKEKCRRNGPVKESFKPFRLANNPQPGLMHRASTCISQQESLKLESDFYAVDEAVKDATLKPHTVKITEINLPRSSSLWKYRDRNLHKHILDSDEKEEDFFYEAAYDDDFDDDQYSSNN